MVKILNFKSQRLPCCQTTKKEFVESFLYSKTQTQKVWKAIRIIKGKGGCNSINHLKINGNLITDKKEVAEILAKTLSKNSLTDNYSDEFQRIKMLKTTPGLLFQKWREV